MKTKELSNSELNAIQVRLDEIYGILGLTVRVRTQDYKAKTKSQLADAAGVHRNTLSDWLNQEPLRSTLLSIGVTDETRVLPPRAVACICEHLGIVL